MLALIAGALLAAVARDVGAAVGAAVLAALAVWAWPTGDPGRWAVGAEGEQATATLLHLLPRRWVVLHDRRVPGSRANIDHLVIGRTGVWVLDTKTSRGRVSSRWRTVWLGDRRLDVRPVAWESAVVADRLCVAARPIVVVHALRGPPGLRPRGRKVSGVRVVPSAGLLRRLKRGRRRIRAPDVARLAALAEDVLPPAG